MMHVFVVRMFFEDGNETDYLGAYSDFWKAAEACVANMREDDSADDCHIVHEMGGGDSVWLEITDNDRPCGTYYSIDKMEVK